MHHDRLAGVRLAAALRCGRRLGRSAAEARDAFGRAPLSYAAQSGSLNAASALLDAGADINAAAGARGRDTALRLAEIQGLRDIAAMLRERGAADKPGL